MGCRVSVFTLEASARLNGWKTGTFGYPRERVLLNSGSNDLWLSATGAVMNGGCRPWC
jgi:hypothetical protein